MALRNSSSSPSIVLATTSPSLPTSSAPVTPSISINRCKIVSTYVLLTSPRRRAGMRAASLTAARLIALRLRQGDGPIIRLQRAQVIPLANMRVSQQPMNLGMVGRGIETFVQIVHYVAQQVRRVLEDDAILPQRVV